VGDGKELGLMAGDPCCIESRNDQGGSVRRAPVYPLSLFPTDEGCGGLGFGFGEHVPVCGKNGVTRHNHPVGTGIFMWVVRGRG